jgi:hypothetical protein
MYDFACISIPTRRIFLKIHIWETTHSCYQYCVFAVEMLHQMPLRFPPTHNYNRTLYDCDCYMVIAASIETLHIYMKMIVCGDACLSAYNGVSECPLLVQNPG